MIKPTEFSCPFCNFLSKDECFVCKNHECFCYVSYSPRLRFWLADCGFEIYVDTERNNTRLHKYLKPYSSDRVSRFSFNDYIYSIAHVDKTLLDIPYALPLNPDNFHQYLNKLLKLIPFS